MDDELAEKEAIRAERRTNMQPSFLKTLAKHIAKQLKKRGFCIVFEDDLERCWPSNQMSEAERESEIQRFAESQRWSTKILEGGLGTRAIFEEPGGNQ